MSDDSLALRPPKLDATAKAADSDLPAFLSRPNWAPVYYGFPLIAETYTDGWCFGAITEFEDPDGCVSGDGFVVAPDGARAGLVWQVGAAPIEAICLPEANRWGVWAVWFPEVVYTVADLVRNFRAVLPALQQRYLEVQSTSTTDE